MQRMLISTNHVLFEGCRSWLAVMYSTPLTAKGPWYLQHVTMKSRSLFSTGHEEQLLAVTYSMSVTIVTPCSVHHTTVNSRSLFSTGHYEQLLAVTYSMSVTILTPCTVQHAFLKSLPVLSTHSNMSLLPTACHYEQSFLVLLRKPLRKVAPILQLRSSRKH